MVFSMQVHDGFLLREHLPRIHDYLEYHQAH